MWTGLALFLTVCMGGIIAYNGDVIGRRYGKRRVTMFGLRPKYTAILVTSVTGVLISAGTTIVLFLLVPPVRNVIMDGENAIAKNHVYRQQNDRLLAQNTALISDQDAKKKELATLTEQAGKTRTALLSTQNDLRVAQARLNTAQQDRDAARSQEKQARDDYARLLAVKQKLQATYADLLKNKNLIAEINVALAKKSTELTITNTRLARVNEEKAKQNSDLDSANTEIANQSVTLTRERDKLQKEVATLTEAAEKIAQRQGELALANATLKQQNDELEAQNKLRTAELIGDYKNLWEAYLASRSRRIAVHKDEDLARIVVPARSTPEEARAAVQKLLHEASESALTRKAGQGDSARAVQVVSRHFVGPSESGGEEAIAVSGQDRIDAVVSQLAWQPNPSAVLAVSVSNTVEGEPVLVELVQLPCRGVFTKGQEVATCRLNAGEPADRLFEEVVSFLRRTGQSALQQGMIPKMDGQGEPQVGSLSAAEIARIVELVREHTGYVRVRAIAAVDIHSADPLALSFKVQP